MTHHTRDGQASWRRYLRFFRADPAADVDDELAFHLQSTVDELVALGMPPDAARHAARRKFGDVDTISRTLYTLSEQREERMDRSEWLGAIRQDIVFGLRQLRKSPGFTVIAVLTLALGIGANSAIFSVVYSVLLQPLPYANAGRIVTVDQLNLADTLRNAPYGNYESWRRQSSDFVALGATTGGGSLALTGHGDPTPVKVDRASAEFWKAMFIPPAAGRYFVESEDRDGVPKVAVLSYALWQSRFNGDLGVIGTSITLNARPVTVVGVAPPDYVLAPPAERVWMPLAPATPQLTEYADHELRVWGLLKPGVTPAVAAEHLRQIETPIARANPHNGYDGRVALTPVADVIIGPQRSNVLMLLGAVGLVLLIACANIANLLLARAAVRHGEIAIRGALGASRRRIIVQLLVESVLLSLAGALLGLVVAVVGVRFLVSAPAGIPRLQNASLNAPVLGFTLLLAVGCAILFGLVPAWRAARMDLQHTLRAGGRDSKTAAREGLRGALVVAELCIAQVLLIGAGLLIRSAMLVHAVPAGFDTHNVLAMSLVLPTSRYKVGAEEEAAFEQMSTAINAVPGVKSAAYAQVAPIYGGGWNWTAQRQGSDGHDAGATTADMRAVSPTYFSTLGVHLLRGRAFTTADAANAPHVAIISRGLATRIFGAINPVGQRISNGGSKPDAFREIVGVVDDIHGNGLRDEPFPAMYMPAAQYPNPSQTFIVRGNVPVTTLLPELRRAVAGVDPLVPLSRVMTMDDAIGERLALSRFNTWLLALLGVTGLILALVGVYGVIGFFVAQRSHEFGVRLALGASSGTVQWLVVKQGLALAAIGVALGVPLSLAATRLLQSLMFGITPHDPLTFSAVAALLAAVAVAASFIPARRATRIDPLAALRA